MTDEKPLPKIASLAEYRGIYFRGFSAGYNRHQLAKMPSVSTSYVYLKGHAQGLHLRDMDDMLFMLGDAFCPDAYDRGSMFELRATIASLRERSALQGRKGEITEAEEMVAMENLKPRALRAAEVRDEEAAWAHFDKVPAQLGEEPPPVTIAEADAAELTRLVGLARGIIATKEIAGEHLPLIVVRVAPQSALEILLTRRGWLKDGKCLRATGSEKGLIHFEISKDKNDGWVLEHYIEPAK